MPDNRIRGALSQAALPALNTIREKLPFLIDLSPEERRALPKTGDNHRNFEAKPSPSEARIFPLRG